MSSTFGRQLCLLVRGQLGALQQSGGQQAASIVRAAAPCASLQALCRYGADIQQSSRISGAWHSYISSSSTSSSSNSSSSSEAEQPEGSTSSSSSSTSSGGIGEEYSPGSHINQLQQAPASAAAPPRPPAADAYAGSFGPRKITPRLTKASSASIKREGIVHVNSTFNNTIMVLTDRDSKVQTWTSGGTVGYKNANKATPMAAELAAKELAKRAVNMGFHSVVVKLKGMGKNKQFAVQSLAANGLTVTQLWDVTPIPYNGCRLPRRRRV